MHGSTWRKQHQAGLTAVELMVVLALVALLAVAATPLMTRLLAQWRVASALNAFSAALRLARTEALASSRAVTLCRLPASGSSAASQCASGSSATGFASGWIVFVDRDGSSTFSASSSDELLLRQDAVPGIAAIRVSGSASSFTFYPSGLGRTPASVEFEAAGFGAAPAPAWARAALCIAKTGRMRPVASASDCGSN